MLLTSNGMALSAAYSPQTPSSEPRAWEIAEGMILSAGRAGPARGLDSTLLSGNASWTFRAVRSGRGRLRVSGINFLIRPGDLIFHSTLEEPTHVGQNVDWVSLHVISDRDAGLLEARLAELPHGLLAWAGAQFAAQILLALPGRVAAAQPFEWPELAGIVLAVLSAAMPTPVGRPGVRPFTKLQRSGAKQRAHQVILANIGSSRLDPAFVAVAAGVSRSSLYRLFEDEGGVSRHIRTTRLSLVRARLERPDTVREPISKIAQSYGFPNAADFSRAFRAAFGVTAQQVRNAALEAHHPFIDAIHCT